MHDHVLIDKMKENNFYYFRCSYCSFTFNDYDTNLYNVVNPLPRLNMRLIESDNCRAYTVSQTFSDNIVKAMNHSIFGEKSVYESATFLMTEIDGDATHVTTNLQYFISERIRNKVKKDEIDTFRFFITNRHTNKQSLEFSKTLNDNNDPQLNDHQVSHVILSIVIFLNQRTVRR